MDERDAVDPNKYMPGTYAPWDSLKLWGLKPCCPQCKCADHVNNGRWQPNGPRMVLDLSTIIWLDCKRCASTTTPYRHSTPPSTNPTTPPHSNTNL